MDLILREYYQWIQVLAYYLQVEIWPFPPQEISRQAAQSQVVIAAQVLDPTLNPKDKDFYIKTINKIDELLAGRREIIDTSQLDVVKIRELVENYEEHLRKSRVEKEKGLSPDFKKSFQSLRTRFSQEIETQSADVGEKFKNNPKLKEIIAEMVSEEVATNLPPVARKTALAEKEYQQILSQSQSKIAQNLKQIGIPDPEAVASKFTEVSAKNTLTLAQEVAIKPHPPIKERVVSVPKEFAPEELVLPEEIIQKLAAKPQGVAFSPLYVALQPQVATPLAQKVIFTPGTTILKMAASETTPEWQEMINKGIFVEDIEATIAKLRETGLPESHPLILFLNEKKLRFVEQQKWKIILPDGTAIYKDKLAVGILKRFYDFDKRTGRLQKSEETTGIFYQTSPTPFWDKQKGYSWQIRQLFNNLGFISRLFEKVKVGPGRQIVRFTLLDRIVKTVSFGRFESFGAIRTVIYQKTIGRAVTYLAQTAIGKAIKEGVKKAATWVAARLGVEAGVMAAGAAGAGPTAGVSLLIAAAVSVVLEIGGRILGKIWDKLKQIFREPEKALGLIAAGIIVGIILPMPIALIAVVPILIGGLGLVSFGVSGAGAIASGLAARTTAFFLALTVAPLTASITTLILLVISILAGFTFFIVITTAGAFVLPVGPTEMIPGPPPPEKPPVIPPPSGLTFRWPVDSPMFCSSNFGYRILENKCDYHEGIDIPASYGAPVYAVAKGIIYDLNFNPGYGNYVVIKHNGFYSFYAHLRGFNVFKGDKVDQSTVIGYVGSSGFSTGPHLHFGFSSCGTVPDCFNDGRYTPDPCNYLISANPACQANCGYRFKEEGCPNL